MTRPDVTSFVDTVTPRVFASRWTKVVARLQSCDMVFFKGESLFEFHPMLRTWWQELNKLLLSTFSLTPGQPPNFNRVTLSLPLLLAVTGRNEVFRKMISIRFEKCLGPREVAIKKLTAIYLESFGVNIIELCVHVGLSIAIKNEEVEGLKNGTKTCTLITGLYQS